MQNKKVPDRYREFRVDEGLHGFAKTSERPRLFVALRDRLKFHYSPQDFYADILSGLVVALVALPLGMALAIASGVAPQHGLYTVIIAGFVVAALGGSRLQVTGPTAAFVVILAPVVTKFGIAGLLVSGFFAGALLCVMGLCRLGKWIAFIPHPVTTGFTAGIALVIATIQIKDFFGLQFEHSPETFFERLSAIGSSWGGLSLIECALGFFTLSILILWPKKWVGRFTFGINQKIPAPLIALSLASLTAYFLTKAFQEVSIATIHSKFSFFRDGILMHGIPQSLPSFEWPWRLSGENGEGFLLNFKTIRELLPSAFAIAMLGAIESLLSAVVADGMAETQHDPDAELLALGIGNMICPFFGGIPATGAIARTATNIRFGAKSPISAMAHSIFVLLAILLFAPWVGYLPMTALAALLLLVAYNMVDLNHFTQILKVAPKSDVAVLLICFALTVVFDMVIGVTAGIVLASLLFMARMSEMTASYRVAPQHHPKIREGLPKQILLYEIAGPLFFGAAQRAISALSDISDEVRIVIFDLREVPILDVSGLVALETCFKALRQKNKRAILCGMQKQPASVILRTQLLLDTERTFLAQTLEEAVSRAKAWTS